MPKTKFGVGDDVKTKGAGGFGPYEGPDPKPGVAYPVELKQCTMRKAQASGNIYVNTGWEITDGECKGYMAWHRIVPGENDFAQQRVAQFMQAICKKNAADIVHDEIEDGGKVNKIGGRNPIGTKSVMFFYRKNKVIEGVSVTETEVDRLDPEHKLIPGQKQTNDEDEPQWESAPSDEVEDDMEDDEDLHTQEELQAMSLKELKELVVSDYDLTVPKGRLTKEKLIDLLVEEGYAEAPADPEEEEDQTPAEESKDEEEDEGSDDEDDDSEEDEDDPVTLAEAEKMSLVQLKELATKWESELDLSSFRGPKGKKALIAGLLKEEILEDGDLAEPPF